MTEVFYAASFFDEMAQAETKRVHDNILDATELLAVIPEMGSTNLPRSISEKYAPMSASSSYRPSWCCASCWMATASWSSV